MRSSPTTSRHRHRRFRQWAVLVAAAGLAASIVTVPGAATAGTAAATRYEAETAPATCDGTIDADWSGYSGGGFCNTDNYHGAAAQFTVHASSATTATLRVKYANGASGRSADLLVNGTNAASAWFASTGSWSTWAWQTWTVQLRAGDNTVRFAATNSAGLPNVDYLEVSAGTEPPPSTPDGWASQNGGTTGGADGSTTTVSTASALSNAISGSTTRTVRVSGTISCSGMLRAGSNKSIIGNPGAAIVGCGLNVSQAHNVIIRNLTFRDWNDDAINVQYSTNVWIDHNTFSNGYDGAVDIKRASDYLTVSWNRFFDHNKTMLLGHSDGNGGEDRGKLRVSYHHNWFDGTVQRHPRVRFGNPVHVFNNYYRSIGSYGVASTQEAGVLVEGNYFENTGKPCQLGAGSSPGGALAQRNNHFVSSGGCASSGSVRSIPYAYQLDSASSVKSIVTSGAGAGRINA